MHGDRQNYYNFFSVYNTQMLTLYLYHHPRLLNKEHETRRCHYHSVITLTHHTIILAYVIFCIFSDLYVVKSLYNNKSQPYSISLMLSVISNISIQQVKLIYHVMHHVTCRLSTTYITGLL